MSTSTAAKVKLDTEVCASAGLFVDLYNNSADLRRNRIGVLYSSNESQLVWNGNPILGNDAISQFWAALPTTEHDISALDAHPLDPDNTTSDIKPPIVAQIMGNVVMGGVSHAYAQVLLLVNEDGNYKIKSESYRFLD